MEKQFNITKEQYLTMLSTWAAKKEHDAADIILYNILRTKPTDRGFTAKTQNIQGNDPWFAYHNALFLARRRVNSTMATMIESRKEAFKKTFGIDIPDGIAEKLEGAKK